MSTQGVAPATFTLLVDTPFVTTRARVDALEACRSVPTSLLKERFCPAKGLFDTAVLIKRPPLEFLEKTGLAWFGGGLFAPVVTSPYMGRDYIRLRSSTEREQLLAEARETFDVDEDSEAIERALRHAVESADALEDVKREVNPELAERLSTSELRLVHYPQLKTR